MSSIRTRRNEWISFPRSGFKTALSTATRYAMPPEFGEKGGAELYELDRNVFTLLLSEQVRLTIMLT